MKESLAKIGIHSKGLILRNASPDELIKEAVERKEGIIAKNGALSVYTAPHTGRSPDDRFFVANDEFHGDINWSKHNKPIDEKVFDSLYAKIAKYLSEKDKIFVFDGRVGASKSHSLHIRVVNEFAWQNLFVHNIFIRPEAEELENFTPNFTLICAPGFKADPAVDGTRSDAFVIVHLSKRIVIIGGTGYGGEMKKSIFTVMNFFMPKQNVLPMHCAANMGMKGGTVLFFGLSGTGKTTLSADEKRKLIGDDEHGWSDNGVFNFEGGCYAKTYKLNQVYEPRIYGAIRHGTTVENVKMDEEGKFVYDDKSLTENGRACYPIHFIDNSELSGKGGIPKVIFFLTADAFGVLPPISKLDYNAAMYHFISGYTSKLAGTETGIIEPKAAFSTLFGAPFMPLHPMAYAKMLGNKLIENKTHVYLVNTGWTGGPYGTGHRISIDVTRALITAAVKGDLEKADYKIHPLFNLAMPVSCPGVDSSLLHPMATWKDTVAYNKQANELAKLFVENISKFDNITQAILDAGPKPMTVTIKTEKKTIIKGIKVRTKKTDPYRQSVLS